MSLATSKPLDASEGARTAQSLVYPNVARDADAVLRAMPAGVQVAFAIRSAASPQSYRLKLDLRDGDVLRPTVPGAKDSTGGPEGAAVVLRDGQGALSISIPSAVDADGRTIAVATRVQDDTVVYTVEHRDADIHYPLLLDPYVAEDQRYWFLNGAVDFNGWQFNASSPGLFGAFAAYSSSYGRGLYIYTATGINYPSGAAASWSFTAPTVAGFEAEGARIIKADFGYTGHRPALYSGSCLQEGIYSRTQNIYEAGGIWRGAQASDSYTAYNAYGMLNCNAEGIAGNTPTYAYRVHCLSVCGDNDGGNETRGTPGNAVVLGMRQGAGYQAQGGVVFMGSSLIFETEQSAPHVTASAPPSGWTDQAFTITATSNDYGVGPSNLSANAGGQTVASVQQGSPCTGAGVQPPEGGPAGSANVGDRNHRCTAPLAASIASSTLPEGAGAVTISSQDILANGTTATTTPRIDRTPPIVTPSGTLNDARNGFVGPSQDYSLTVTATDGSLSSQAAQRSGVTSLSATLDGQPMTSGSASAACTRPEGSCALTINTTLTAAEIAELDESVPHTIEIKASDALGHTTTDSFSVRVDSTAPSMFFDGILAQLSGRVLGENDYRLRVEARDNEPFQGERDDDGEAMPITDTPGAGLRDVVVRLDGQSVATGSSSCFDDPACDQARVWDWNTTAAANGVHSVTITATDRVGNQDVEEFEVDLQRLADQPARTATTVRRTINGAADGDRAGAATASLGDVNGDGYSDFLIGAPGATKSGVPYVGAAYVVLGGPDASTVNLAAANASVRRIVGPGQGWYCGTSVAAAGDINGDGLGDLLVGCPGVDTRIGSLLSRGRVYVIFGRSDPQDIDLANLGDAGFIVTGPTDSYNLTLPALTSRPAVFGERLQSASPELETQDVNDDGFDDMIIGDSAVAQGSQAAAGAAYVVYGKEDNATVDVTALGDRGFTIRGTLANSLTGYSATIIDDINGDTVADIAVGAPGTTAAIGGRAYVVSGAAHGADGELDNQDIDLGSPASRVVTLTSGQAGDRFGVSVAALGDTNIDMVPDIAIGTSSGAYVLRTIPSSSRQVTADDGYRIAGPSNQPSLLTPQVPEAPISPAQDLDGDERADLIIGYPDTSAARAYTIRSPEGSRTVDVTTLPGQRGAAINSGTRSDRSGVAVAASSYQGTTPVSEVAQAIVGAPDTGGLGLPGVGAGRAYVVAEPTPIGPGVEPAPDEPEEAGFPGAAASSSESSDTTSSQVQAAATRRPPDAGTFNELFNRPRPGYYKVAPEDPDTYWVTVRNDAQLLVIGNASDQGTFHVEARKDLGPGSTRQGNGRGFYYHGRLFGQVKRCGWVNAYKTAYVGAIPSGNGKPCNGGALRRLPPKRFARLINCDHCDDGATVRLRGHSSRDRAALATRSTIPYWRNVQPGTNEGNSTASGSISVRDGDVRTQVAWRYLTRSQGRKFARFALVRAPSSNPDLFGNNKWAFIERRWLPRAVGRYGLCDNTAGGERFGEMTQDDDENSVGGERLDYEAQRATDFGRRLKRGDWPSVCSHRLYGVATPGA